MSLFETLGKNFEGLIVPLLEWMKNSYVGPGLAASIVFIAVVVALFVVMTTWRDYQLIKKAADIIGDTNETLFATSFNTINQDLHELKKFRRPWGEFNETLIHPKAAGEGRASLCANTVRPHEFFNVYQMGMGPNFTKIFPSVFVGIGLALTFLGLIAALSTAVTAIAPSETGEADASAVRDAIAELLKISSAKFYASLFALFSSVVLTLVIKFSTHIIDRKLMRFCDRLESGVRFISAESLAMNANDILSAQLLQLNTFNTDLAMKIGQEVQASLSPLIVKIGAMGEQLSGANIDAIKNITDHVVESIHKETSGSMDRVAATLDQVSEKLGGLSDILTSALSNFDSDFTAMLAGLKNSLQESTITATDGIEKSIRVMEKGVAASAGEVTAIIASLTGTVEGLAKAGAQISREGGETLRREVEDAAKNASKQMAVAGETLASGFKESTADLTNAMNGVTAQVKMLESELSKLPTQLGQVNTNLESSSTMIGHASSSFVQASGGLKDMIVPLATYATQTKESMETISNSLTVASDNISGAGISIRESVNTLSTQIAAQLDALDGSDEKLAGLLSGIENSTSLVLGKINTFVSEVDRSFSVSIGALHETMTDFEEILDRISEKSQKDNN